mmetsp:Transcript_6573/g.20842  ORF Transcript_6573/g.20842 Transcript_6573/m.20842 type:complete len:211 (-) Transcript_6573:67-699(-)
MSSEETKGAASAAKAEAGSDIPEADVKVILLGDSAVGKSKLVERFLMDEYQPRQLSTYALTLFRHESDVDGKTVKVDFWDTAGQERFSSMHPSYYFKAHSCILVFDVTRKATYLHLKDWYKELRKYCENIPVICVANKIDVDINVTNKKFKFPEKYKMPFFWVSAADGTNVVQVFNEAIKAAWQYKNHSSDFFADVMQLLDEDTLGDEEH